MCNWATRQDGFAGLEGKAGTQASGKIGDKTLGSCLMNAGMTIEQFLVPYKNLPQVLFPWEAFD